MDVRAPYPGLRAFRQDESDLFFGRDEEADVILERLATNRFVGVLGASGSGKSSLVRTTVFEALEGGFSGIGSQWRFVDCRPGGAPIAHLAQELAKTSAIEGETGEPEKVEAWLRRGPLSIVEWCEAGGLASDCQLLILIDQFEELFNYASNAARGESQAFASMLMESARSGRAPIYVLITMRSEYFGATAAYPEFAEMLTKGLFLTPRMLREACREAIVGPAAVVGFEVREDLVNRLLNDMERLASFARAGGGDTAQAGRQADQLPLMQYALNSMWRSAMARGQTPIVLTLDDYSAIGGLSGALDSHGGEVIAALSLPEDTIGRVFRALVKGPNAALGVRDPHTVAEIAAISGISLDAVLRVVAAFSAADSQFLRADLPLTALTYVDITHESLIRQWGKLSGWLTEEADAAEVWTQLAKNTESWDAGGRLAGALLSGLLLARPLQWWKAEAPTEAWAARYSPPSTRGHEPVTLATARAFLDAGEARRLAEARAEAHRRRQLQWLGAASIGALVVLMGGFGAGGLWIARQQTVVAQSQRQLAQNNYLAARQQAKYAENQRLLALQNEGYANQLVLQRNQLIEKNIKERELQAQAQNEAQSAKQSLAAVLELVGTSAAQLAANVDKPETAAADTRDEAEQLASFLEKRRIGTVADRAPTPEHIADRGRGPPPAQESGGAKLTKPLVNLDLIAAESAADSVGVKDPSAKTADLVDERATRIKSLVSEGRACSLPDAEFAAQCGALDVMRGRSDALRRDYPAAARAFASAFEGLQSRSDPDSLAWAFEAATRLIDLHLLLDDPLMLAAVEKASAWCAASPLLASPLPLDPASLRDRKRLALLLLQCQLAAADLEQDHNDKDGAAKLLSLVSQQLLSPTYRDENNLRWARAVIALSLLAPADPNALAAAQTAAATHLSRSDTEEAHALRADSLRGDAAPDQRLDFLAGFAEGWDDQPFVLRTLQLYLRSSFPPSDAIDNLDVPDTGGDDSNQQISKITRNLNVAISLLVGMQRRIELINVLQKNSVIRKNLELSLGSYSQIEKSDLELFKKYLAEQSVHLIDIVSNLFHLISTADDALSQLQTTGAVTSESGSDGSEKYYALYLSPADIRIIDDVVPLSLKFISYCSMWPAAPGIENSVAQACDNGAARINEYLKAQDNFHKIISSAENYYIPEGLSSVKFDGKDLSSYHMDSRGQPSMLLGRTDVRLSYPFSADGHEEIGTLLFSTEYNKNLFKQNPAAYMPIFYGYAIDWLAFGELRSGPLENRCLIDGHLVLFSTASGARWCASNPGGSRARALLATANRQWAALGPAATAHWGKSRLGTAMTPVKRKADKLIQPLNPAWLEYHLKQSDHVVFPTTGILSFIGLSNKFEMYRVELADGSFTYIFLQGTKIDDKKLFSASKEYIGAPTVREGDPIPFYNRDKLTIMRWGETTNRAVGLDKLYANQGVR